jgi:hypothetical protein
MTSAEDVRGQKLLNHEIHRAAEKPCEMSSLSKPVLMAVLHRSPAKIDGL